MSEPFVAQIKLLSFSHVSLKKNATCPRGYALCNGQTMAIHQNEILFVLLKTTYGGNGYSTFALPDMRGRTPVGEDKNNHYPLGSMAGSEYVSLTVDEMPAHRHAFYASTENGNQATPAGNILANLAGVHEFVSTKNNGLEAGNSDIIASKGQGAPHSNMQPYLVIRFCIALKGLFPERD